MENMDARLVNEQEFEVLRMISSVNFDYTFRFDCVKNTASVTRYVSGNVSEPELYDDFTAFVMSKVHPDDVTLIEKEFKKMNQAAANVGFEIRLKESGGRRYRWHSVRLCLDKNGNGLVYVGSSTIIDSRKNKESELTIKARQDLLTGLLNKVTTQESVSAYLKKNQDATGAMIVFDIDNFKNYNDCMGHLFGDEVIKEVATKIRRIFSKDSFVGRIGGDEFLVFVKDMADVAFLVQRMGQLRDAVADITLGQRSRFRISLSIGISLFPDMGRDFESLFQAADMALYSVKNNGKNSYAFYTDELYNEDVIKQGERRLEKATVEDKAPESLTNFAFQLLNESENVSSAVNLLLYRIQNDYDLEAIHLHELDSKNIRTEVTYEICKDGNPSFLGRRFEFSYKALKKYEEAEADAGGYIIYDFTGEDKPIPGNGVENWGGVGSMLHIGMRLFSKKRGCIDLISRHPARVWTKNKVAEIMSVANLLTVCLYYSGKVQKAEREVLRHADFDSLTGLMKEDHFIEVATRIVSTRGNSSKLALIYCDISNFKYINEAYGYMVGDRLLSDFADYISNKIKGVLCAGRFYSDNILCIHEFPKNTTDERLTRQVEIINENLSSFLSNKFKINNIAVRTGIYIIPDEKADVLQSISNANMARKIAKGNKNALGARCVVFDQGMFEKRKRQIKYIQALDEGIKNNEFYIVMQPKVSGTENKLVGAEALVRWRMADGMEVYPSEFVPAFEKDGSIVKLDFFVYEKVMAYIRERLDEGKKVLPISMNVSRAHLLFDNFVERFVALIEKYDIPTQYIELELTESVYLEDLSTFNEMINELRLLGIKISMDDFGSGYSSLNALNDLKIDLLKIDRIFMKDDCLKESDKTIIRFIIDMAKNLSMKVMCEGVETDSQRRFLNEAGCNLHQGYLYSKPVEIKIYDEYIENEEILFAKVV